MRLFRLAIVAAMTAGLIMAAGCDTDKAPDTTPSAVQPETLPSVATTRPNDLPKSGIDDPKLTIDDLTNAFGMQFEQIDEQPIKTMGRLTVYATDGFSVGVIQAWASQGWLTWSGVQAKKYPTESSIAPTALLVPDKMVVVFKGSGQLMGTYVSVTLDTGKLPANGATALAKLGKIAYGRM